MRATFSRSPGQNRSSAAISMDRRWAARFRRNKTFFFVDWQGTRLRTGVTRFSVVPTLAQRQGIFTQAIFDPATSPRTQFPSNTIPLSRFDPTAIQILAALSGSRCFRSKQLSSEPPPNPTIRIRPTSGWIVISDDKHRAFGRYTFFPRRRYSRNAVAGG